MTTTWLEAEAIGRILRAMGWTADDTKRAVTGVTVQRREWSTDAADPARCIGQFVYLQTPEAPPGPESLGPSGIWASHDAAPGGMDFLLFFEGRAPSMLEIGSFGISVPRTLISDADADRFRFADVRVGCGKPGRRHRTKPAEKC